MGRIAEFARGLIFKNEDGSVHNGAQATGGNPRIEEQAPKAPDFGPWATHGPRCTCNVCR